MSKMVTLYFYSFRETPTTHKHSIFILLERPVIYVVIWLILGWDNMCIVLALGWDDMWPGFTRFKPECANIFSSVNYANKKLLYILKKIQVRGFNWTPEHK